MTNSGVRLANWMILFKMAAAISPNIAATDGLITGGHRTRVADVTLDNMAEGVFAQREDLP